MIGEGGRTWYAPQHRIGGGGWNGHGMPHRTALKGRGRYYTLNIGTVGHDVVGD